MSLPPEPEQAVEVTYKGVPNHADADEGRGVWAKFRAALAEAIKPLCSAAGLILQSAAEKRAWETRKIIAEASLIMAQAKKTAAETSEITARLDQANAKHTKAIRNVEGMSINELRAALGDDFAEWLAMAERLRLLHGTEIKWNNPKLSHETRSISPETLKGSLEISAPEIIQEPAK